MDATFLISNLEIKEGYVKNSDFGYFLSQHCKKKQNDIDFFIDEE